MILDKIVEQKKISLEVEKRENPLVKLKEEIDKQEYPKSLKRTLTEAEGTRIIGEIKKASPSLGIIGKKNFDPVHIARIYEENGAKAISVITEKDFFLGDLTFLKKVKGITRLPVLRKDFLFDDYHIFQSRASGADAVLLIVRILEVERLKGLMDLTKELGMEALTEVHDEKELEIVLQVDADIIGINNRNLSTFEVSLEVTRRLMTVMPESKVVVSESGIKSRQDVLSLERCGVTAFLVGETLMRAQDASLALGRLLGTADDQ